MVAMSAPHFLFRPLIPLPLLFFLFDLIVFFFLIFLFYLLSKKQSFSEW